MSADPSSSPAETPQLNSQGGGAEEKFFVPSACCIAGTVSSHVPTGKEETFGKLKTYLALPDEKQATDYLLIICPDSFGYATPNVRELADRFAKLGYVAIVPDYFEGTAPPLEIMDKAYQMWMYPGLEPAKAAKTFGEKLSRFWAVSKVFIPFLWRHGRPAPKVPLVDSVIEDARKRFNSKKVALIGYCYGGYFGIHYSKVANSPVDAVAYAHAEANVPGDMEALRKPALMVVADRDPLFPLKKYEAAKAALAKREDAQNFPIKFYPGTYHGFAVRGDDEIEAIRIAKEDAFQQFAAFLSQHLGGPNAQTQ